MKSHWWSLTLVLAQILNCWATRNMFRRTQSLTVQLFHFWSLDVHSVQNLLLCTKFHENLMIFRRNNMSYIYIFSKWRPSAILELFYHHMRPPTNSLLLAAAACQISCQSDTQIWIFRIFGLKCLFRPPKLGFWGNLYPKCDIHHRDPQKAHPCINPRLLSYQL